MNKFLFTITILFFLYFSVVCFYYIMMGILGIFESRRRFGQDLAEDYNVFGNTRFTIPISFIIPAHNEEAWIADCLLSVLNINYPEFEVIVVNDGSTDKTFEILNKILDLESINTPYIDNFKMGRLKGLFKSRRYPYVTVMNKESGYKKAGALNAGLNLAKYKYICIMDADTIIEPDAVLKVMAHVQKDPESIIGAGSYFGLVNGFKIKEGKIIERNFTSRPLIAYQNLEYIRSFIGNRITWSKLNSTAIVSGGFGIWRRDVVRELGGFSPNYSSEDLEFTFRAYDYIIKNHKNSKILMLPYCVGWTAAPINIRGLIKQRDRWQRVTDEAVKDYWHMFFNPRYGAMGLVVFPYYFFYEVLGAFFEFSSILLLITGIIFKAVNLNLIFALFLFMILTQTSISLLYLFIFNRIQKFMPASYIIYLGFLSFFEFFWYRWIIIIAKLKGTYKFLMGVRTHDQVAKKSI